VIEGGTHNEGAPPFEFLDLGFAPLLRRMGADLTLTLEKPGFYPVGGGRIRARVGKANWRRLELLESGERSVLSGPRRWCPVFPFPSHTGSWLWSRRDSAGPRSA
jgi:RNA 3'-terminal phosphate cyclase